MQQGVQTDATCNIRQCWELLANNVASVCTGFNAQKHHAEIFEHKFMYLLNPTVSTILPYIKLHRSNKQIVWAPFDESQAIIVWFVLD